MIGKELFGTLGVKGKICIKEVRMQRGFWCERQKESDH
jgi:hypothetical protein